MTLKRFFFFFLWGRNYVIRRIVSNFNVRCRGVRTYTISIEQKLLQELDSSWAHIHRVLSLQYFIAAIQYNFYMSRIIVSLTRAKISPSWACTNIWRIFLIQNSKLLDHKFIFYRNISYFTLLTNVTFITCIETQHKHIFKEFWKKYVFKKKIQNNK